MPGAQNCIGSMNRTRGPRRGKQACPNNHEIKYLKKEQWLYSIEASPHTLRHTHIVHALLDRIPITAVQKQVGHKKLTTTQIYSNLAPEQVREAYESR